MNFVFGKLGRDKDDEAAGGEPASPTGGRRDASHMNTVTSAGSVAETTAAEVAADFVCSARFADHFWSSDERCIGVLMHKLKSAKQTCTDVLHVATARAQMEEELGKKLGKLARAGLGAEEVGATRSALRTVRAEMEAAAKAHGDLAKQLRAEIERPLAAFIGDQRAKRRAQTAVIQKTEGDRNALRSQLRKLQDKRRADTKRVGDLDLQCNGLQGSGDPKLRAKLERAQMQQRATEGEYADVRARLRDADAQWFNAWRAACDVFQVLEEERVEYLKTALWAYTNLVSGCCVADDESMERIRQDLEKISVADDIAAFIRTFGTGSPDPELARAADDPAHKPPADDGDDSDGDGRPARAQPQKQQQQQQHSAIATPANTNTANINATNSVSNNTVNSVSTSSGTARSGSIMAHPLSSRPQTQESMRYQPQNQQQMSRPASMHAAAPQMPPMANNRPPSAMHDNTYRRASNND
ncbi:formin-binding protein, partial [Coemansia sp. RSA 2708]